MWQHSSREADAEHGRFGSVLPAPNTFNFPVSASTNIKLSIHSSDDGPGHGSIFHIS